RRAGCSGPGRAPRCLPPAPRRPDPPAPGARRPAPGRAPALRPEKAATAAAAPAPPPGPPPATTAAGTGGQCPPSPCTPAPDNAPEWDAASCRTIRVRRTFRIGGATMVVMTDMATTTE